MQVRDIRPGAVFRITMDSEEHTYRVIQMCDGKVTVRLHKARGEQSHLARCRWWLPVEHVKRDGFLISPRPKGTIAI